MTRPGPRLWVTCAWPGRGVEPALHVEFERRFGLPLIEVWGMTEMCRVFSMEDEPRMIGTRAFGRAYPGCEVQVWDDQNHECPRGVAGEMVLRHSAETPRKGVLLGLSEQGRSDAGGLERWVVSHR